MDPCVTLCAVATCRYTPLCYAPLCALPLTDLNGRPSKPLPQEFDHSKPKHLTPDLEIAVHAEAHSTDFNQLRDLFWALRQEEWKHHPEVTIAYTCDTILSFGPMGWFMIPYHHKFDGISTFEPDNVDVTLFKHVSTNLDMIASR